MVFLNPLDKTGTYKSVRLESTRKGDIEKAVRKLNIVIINPKKKTYYILSKHQEKENIPKSLRINKTTLPRSSTNVPNFPKSKEIDKLTTNINIPPPPPQFPNLQNYSTAPAAQEPSTPVQPVSIPQPTRILPPQERLLPKTSSTPRFIGTSIRDIIFQITRLRYLLRHFDGIITDPSEKIIFQNFKYNYAQVTQAQNIKTIKYYLNKILLELNSLLSFRNPSEDLSTEINLLNDSTPLESKIKTLIDDVLTKFYSSINVEDANTSDFTKTDLYQLYTNFDIKKYPIIDSFLREQAVPFGQDFINQLNYLSNLPHAPTDLNSQYQLISFFILKYGLTFPTTLSTFFLNHIKNNLNNYKDLIINYINNNTWDQSTYNIATQNLGLDIPNPNISESLYEGDILAYQKPTTAGSTIRSAQQVYQPIRNLSQRVLTNAWRNPIQTGVKLTTALGAGKTLLDYASGDNSIATDFGMYNLKSGFEELVAEQATSNIDPQFKNIFKPFGKYAGHKIFETGQSAINTAIPVVQGIGESLQTVGNQITDATQAVTNLGNTIGSYIPFTGQQPIQEVAVEEIQIPASLPPGLQPRIPDVLPPLGPAPSVPAETPEQITARNTENFRELLDRISTNYNSELGGWLG